MNEYDIFVYDDFKEIVSKAIRTDLGSGEASAEETVQTFDCDRFYVVSGSGAMKSRRKRQHT